MLAACQTAKHARILFPQQRNLVQQIHDEIEKHPLNCELRISRMEEGGLLEPEEQFARIAMIGKLTQQISIAKQACFGLRFAMALLGTDHDCLNQPWPGEQTLTVE